MRRPRPAPALTGESLRSALKLGREAVDRHLVVLVLAVGADDGLDELTHRRDAGAATRVATGALVGRAVAAAIKTAFGLAIAVLLVVSVL